MKKILIVDDSAFMRRVVSDIINSDSRYEVIDTAKNGKEGLEKINSSNPDLIILDIQMPIMDGLEMLEILMKTNPKPVVILSTLAKEGAETTIKALELGAIDFILKPQNIFNMNDDEMKTKLLDKIMVGTSVSNFPQNKIINNVTKKTNYVKSTNNNMKKLVVLGTSTGGPRALQEVIPKLPKDIKAGIVIVQHMPPGFTKSLSERLNSMSEINVKEAENDDIIEAGNAYLAPGDKHVVIVMKGSELCIKLSDTPPVGGHKPAVNVLFNSVCDINYMRPISVIMTGMGSDGCEGMKNMKKNNEAYIIAQDEKSCVVYGMPKSVVEANIADVVVPLQNIAKEITKMVEVY